jgi:hypothetical protein
MYDGTNVVLLVLLMISSAIAADPMLSFHLSLGAMSSPALSPWEPSLAGLLALHGG